MNTIATMSEKKLPRLPRRRRSQNSDSSGQSGNGSYRSAPEGTERTGELTPSHDSIVCHGPSPKSTQSLPFDDKQLGLKLDELYLGANRSVRPSLTEGKIRVFLGECIEDYASMGESDFQAWSLFYGRYFSPDYIFIRPSGNPIDCVELAHQFSTDSKILDMKLVSIDAITIMESKRSAVVVYTTEHVFVYRGTRNEDRTVVSCVLEYRGNELKIVHEHRTSGTPVPRETRWLTGSKGHQ